MCHTYFLSLLFLVSLGVISIENPCMLKVGVMMLLLLLVLQVDLPQFKVGDLVRVSGDLEKVQSLQQGHGGWSNAVLLVCDSYSCTFVYAESNVYTLFLRGACI